MRSFGLWPRILSRRTSASGLIFLGLVIILLRVRPGLTSDSAWQTVSPEEVGLNRIRLDALRDSLADRHTDCLLILRHDRIAYEWYAPGWNLHKRHYIASLAKALVGGMSLMVAFNDDRLKVGDPAWKYIPVWKHDPLKSRITIKGLATHTSGLEDAEEGGKPHEKLTGWKGDFWKRKPNPFWTAIHETPVVFPPETKFAYSNPGFAALAYAITASLYGEPQPDILTLLKRRIMRPIGVADSDWSIGYGKPADMDGLKLYATWGGASYTTRAVARVGQLMLHRGEWNGNHLVTRYWAKRMVSYSSMPLPNFAVHHDNELAMGLAWWTNHGSIFRDLPPDAFIGEGAGQQFLLVVPSLDLVVVRLGERLPDPRGVGSHRILDEDIIHPLMQALVPQPPCPPRKLIHQYTAYGDGEGFEPGTGRGLNLGFARDIGLLSDLRGINIRSANGEREGAGSAGAKTCVMLMFNGVLDMFVRIVRNSQLAWPENHVRTWDWGFHFTRALVIRRF